MSGEGRTIQTEGTFLVPRWGWEQKGSAWGKQNGLKLGYGKGYAQFGTSTKKITKLYT